MLEELLLELLREWDRYRSPALAVAIERLNTRLARRQPPIEDAQRWHHAAARRDPLAVSALLAAPCRRDRPSTMRRKLLALADFPPDPRLWAFAREVLAFIPTRPGADLTRQAAMELAAKHGPPPGDPESPAHLDALLARVQALPDLEEELLAAIVASPDDDGPRLVYADYLIERGDPMGEPLLGMIRGTGGPPAGQERERWCRRLLGGSVNPDTVSWRRGFAGAVHLVQAPLPIPGPGWHTVEQISLSRLDPDVIAWLCEAKLPNLRSLDLVNLHPLDASSLYALAPLQIRAISAYAEGWTAQHGQRAHWPALQRLSLMVVARWVQLDEARLGEIARHPLEISLCDPYGLPQTVGGAIVALPAAGAGIQRVVVTQHWPDGGIRVQIARGERLAVTIGPIGWHNVDQLAPAMRRVEPGALASLAVELDVHGDLEDRKLHTRIRRALGRFRALPVEISPRSRGSDGPCR